MEPSLVSDPAGETDGFLHPDGLPVAESAEIILVPVAKHSVAGRGENVPADGITIGVPGFIGSLAFAAAAVEVNDVLFGGRCPRSRCAG